MRRKVLRSQMLPRRQDFVSGANCDPRCCPGAQPRCGTSWHGGVAVPFGGHGTFFVRRGGRPWALPSQAASMPIDKNCVLRAGTGLARHAMSY